MILADTKRVHRFFTEFRAMKGHKFEEYSSTQKTVGLLMLFYFVWVFIGLLSSQWVVFSMIFIISFIPKKYIFVRWLDSLVTLIALLFILMNAYHFKIDVYQFLLSL
jgi:hypothetical protein